MIKTTEEQPKVLVPRQFVESRGGITEVSKCGLFYITKSLTMFAITEINPHDSLTHLYLGDCTEYTHTLVNAVLTRMRAHLMQEYLATLKECPLDKVPVASFSPIAFHIYMQEMDSELRNQILLVRTIYKLNGNIVLV